MQRRDACLSLLPTAFFSPSPAHLALRYRYASYQGFLPCPEAPDTCCTPQPLYPEMHRALGAPLGPRAALGQYKWQREFEHAVVTLDLEDPLGPGTSIVWS